MICNKGITHKGSHKHYLYNRWQKMIHRCYNPKNSDYKNYGAKGVIVEDYLLDFNNYVKFIESLYNSDKLKNESKLWCIDKDMNGGNIYSRKTIKIITSSENSKEVRKRTDINENKRKIVYQYTLDGKLINKFNGVRAAERETGVSHKRISDVCRGIRKTQGGFIWSYELLDKK